MAHTRPRAVDLTRGVEPARAPFPRQALAAPAPAISPPDPRVGDILPYGRQLIEEDDIEAVAEALRSDFLTTGPRAEAFEQAFAERVGAKYAVTCSSGTAALHITMMALGVKPGDVCIVPTVTFLSTATCARFQHADVIFCDVDPDTGLMTPETLEAAFNKAGDRRVAAVLPVHLGGRLVEMPQIAAICAAKNIPIVEDSCHALGSVDHFGQAGDCRYSLATCFSFHPVKTIATGEGGMVTTNDPDFARRLRLARSHGTVRDGFEEPWYYEQQSLGMNYRLTDVQCALGLSQLRKLDRFIDARRNFAARYGQMVAELAPVVRTVAHTGAPAFHLYTVLVDFERAGLTRSELVNRMKTRGIGTQVHYIPVHTQPYFKSLYGEQRLPGAESWYRSCLSLPLHPSMTISDVDRTVAALFEALP